MSDLQFNPPLSAERLSDGAELPIEDAAIAVWSYGFRNGDPCCVVTNRRGEFVALNPVYVRVIDARVISALATATTKMTAEREPEAAA